jgi:hypothetical protein
MFLAVRLCTLKTAQNGEVVVLRAPELSRAELLLQLSRGKQKGKKRRDTLFSLEYDRKSKITILRVRYAYVPRRGNFCISLKIREYICQRKSEQSMPEPLRCLDFTRGHGEERTRHGFVVVVVIVVVVVGCILCVLALGKSLL